MGIITTVGEFQVLEMVSGFRVYGSGLSRHALHASISRAILPTLAGAVALASCASVNETRMTEGAYRSRLARCIHRHGGKMGTGFYDITPVVAA